MEGATSGLIPMVAGAFPRSLLLRLPLYSGRRSVYVAAPAALDMHIGQQKGQIWEGAMSEISPSGGKCLPLVTPANFSDGEYIWKHEEQWREFLMLTLLAGLKWSEIAKFPKVSPPSLVSLLFYS